MSKKLKKAKFVGIDYVKKKIKRAKSRNKNENIKFIVQNLKKKTKLKKSFFDLIFSVHATCCFKKIDEPLKFMFKLKPKWIALNSLFYDGPLDVLIHIRDYSETNIDDNNVNSDFNIFSIENMKKILKKNGYEIFKLQKFFPNKKISQPKKGKRGSYTIKTDFNKNTTFSGPVHLPWCFVLIKKINNDK